MNNIAFGIFCFGEDFYFEGTKNKIKNILDYGYTCFVLTDDSDYFEKYYPCNFVKIIQYKKQNKSYHDKLILPKHILENHDICILIDADVEIFDYTFLTNLKTYSFSNGISYIETLETHPSRMNTISKIDMSTDEWSFYYQYYKSFNIDISNHPTIWEYFLVFNKSGFNQNIFYKFYEKLQIAKDYCNLNGKKEISGMGEGVSITIASTLSNTELTLDKNLFKLIQNKMISVSRKFTNPNNLPDWIK